MRWVKASERLPENGDKVYCVRWTLDGGTDWFYGSAPGIKRIEKFHEWLDESSSPVESDAVKINVLEKQNQQHREALEMIANEISDGEESTFHFLRRLRIIASQALK